MGNVMSDCENLFGQSPRSIAVVFNLLLNQLVFKNNHVSSENFSETMSNLEEAGLFFQIDVCVKHAEMAKAFLCLQSLAFLTDEQKVELSGRRSELMDDWKRILEQNRQLGIGAISENQLSLDKIDSLLITQLEWMSDVGFEKCSRERRLSILPESPVFEAFEMG